MVWHDIWLGDEPLSKYISHRIVYEGRFKNDAAVADLYDDGKWRWPQDWFDEFPILKLTNNVKLQLDKVDKAVWVDKKKREIQFTVGRAWKDFRHDKGKVDWAKSVWYSQCIPKHSFVSWVAMHGRLNTQDRIVQWFPGKQMQCALCAQGIDSHEHLFFKCRYSSHIWNKVKKKPKSLWVVMIGSRSLDG